MKKAIYIWMLCLGGLFLSQQSFAQHDRGHARKAHSSKSYRKAEKNYHKSSAKAYKHYQKKGPSYSRNHRVISRGDRGHYYSRDHRGNHYSGRRIVTAPRGHHYYGAPWAARRHYDYHRHVYFPDYHAFYDARRHGYVYRNRGRWIFTQTLPSFMVGLNWNNVRIQYLQGVPVTAYPQTYYDTYSSRYPAVSLNLNLNL